MILDLLKLNKGSETPLFRQLTLQLMELIQSGILPAGYALPGSRIFARKLGIHRKTVVAALDQLVIQGWLETVPGKGTFVAENLKPFEPVKLKAASSEKGNAPGLIISEHLQRELHVVNQKYHLDDGLPDPRLAPTTELAGAYKTSLTKGHLYPKYTYADTKGHGYLRQVLCDYLRETRGLKLTKDQVMITRGVTQALYLCIQGLLEKGDKVAVGELNWESANANFLYHEMKLVKIKVDQEGLDTEDLEGLLQEHKIRMIYLTPHHQYPTTVIMPAHRRVKLIQLARKYGFYVFEDDYDYDFHYNTHPLMPLATVDHGDFVLYTGSFTKAISPVFRVGYLVANENQIDYLARIRRMVDRQGDTLLELAIAELLNVGIIQRSLRKNKKIYQQRRNSFAVLLEAYLGPNVSFEMPAGGMSFWTQFDQGIDLKNLSQKALKHDLYFPDGAQFSASNIEVNATRLGFASSTEQEQEKALQILKGLI